MKWVGSPFAIAGVMLCQSANFWNRKFAQNIILWGALLLLARLSALADQSVTLTWNPSPDTNVAGYKIYYGAASRVYTNSVTSGNVTNVTVSGLSGGATYYFGATTLDASGNESDFSNEATYDILQVVSNSLPEVVNQPPTLDAIANLTIYQNAGSQTVLLTGITSGSTNESQRLTVSASSSSPAIIPAPTVNYTSANSSGTLAFAPMAGALGTATVTVMVDDGGASNNITAQTFTVTVVSAPAPNQPPTLDAITNLTIYKNAGPQTVFLTGITSGSTNENQSLIVSATSSNSKIIPVPTINYTNSNSSGTLTFAPVTNAVGAATVTVMVNDGGTSNNITVRTFTVTVVTAPVVNQPPTLNFIAKVTVNQNAAAQTITLTGITSGSPTEKQTLKVGASSSNPSLVPTPTIRYASPASSAQLTFKPKVNSSGVAIITVTVNDGGKSNNLVRQSFTVTVLPNQPPTLNFIAKVTVNQNAAAQTITLTGITSGSPTEKQTLKVGASSSNPSLVPTPTIRYASPASSAQLTFKPKVNSSGVAIITVTVNDGGKSNNVVRQSFTVTVTSALANSSSKSGSSSGSTTLAQANLTVNSNTVATLTTVASPKGQFSFQVTGVSGGQYVVQATSDLIHWTSVQTNSAPFTFQDTNANGFSQRYYRAYFLP